MTQYRDHIAGLIREYHHIKVKKADDEDWEPAMVITRNRIKGKSFIILLGALWKYLDPIHNQDPKVLAADMEEFEEIMRKCEFRERTAVTIMDRGRAAADHVCVEFAGLINKSHGFLLCTGYNLAKCMQMMEIWPKGNLPQAAAQLLMWIQDGLDDLKNMPEHPGDEQVVAGEVDIFCGSTKIATKDVTVSETELMEGSVE